MKYIKGSKGRKKNFEEYIPHVALVKKRGIHQDILTRWNLTYLMLDKVT